MVKANQTFKLSERDIEIIEHALRAKAGRRGLAIANGETSDQLRAEMNEIQELLHIIQLVFKIKKKLVLRETGMLNLEQMNIICGIAFGGSGYTDGSYFKSNK